MKNKVIYLVIVILLVLFAYKYGINSASNTSSISPTPTGEVGLCTRTTPYDNPPELVRALSLTSQDWNAAPNAPKPKGSAKNCVHLIYKNHSEMNGAEGYVSFDKTSDPNDLRIYVDSDYKNYDDILTASLLGHELVHIVQFGLALEGNKPVSCVESEVQAFFHQVVFLTNLNPEEWKSITYRVGQNPNLNSAYQITDYLLRLNASANQACPDAPDQTCWNNYVMGNLRSWIASNPYYQKECHL